LVEKTSPFWNRYPDQYIKDEGRQTIWPNGWLSDDHQFYVKPEYFEFLGSCNRFPRYKNKRGVDPQVQCFIDESGVEYEKTWDLPIPNQKAAYISLSKYGKSETLMAPEMVQDLNKAWEWTVRQFMPYMGEARILTVQEAVDHLDMSTSSGAPFNFKYKTKKELFENHPEIVDWLQEDWEVLANDPKWTCIFSSSLKEELRPMEKIQQNSIRTFTAGPVDATVHGSRLFVDMNEKLYASHLKSASTVGMSPLGGNWHKLYQKLNVFPNGYALDESQYDSSLRAFLMSGCAKMRWLMLAEEFKTPANLNRIRTYYRNLTHTVIMTAEGNLIYKKLGNPSGSVNTVSDNTLILYWMLAFAWIRTASKDVCTYTDFELNTAKCLLGDDNTWTVSEFAHGFYNAISVIEEWKHLGITTTTDSLEPRPAIELDFLSAHTVFLKGYAVPLYDRNKLMQSLLYAPMKHLTPETSLQRVNNLLQIGWTDLPFRRFCREFISWLLCKYDDTLKDDQRWIIAKSQIWTDEQHFQLFTGRKLILRAQSYQETQERLNKPDKRNFMNSVQQKKTQNPRRRNRRGGAKKRPQGAKKQQNRQQQPRPRKTLRQRGGRTRGRRSGQTALGLGATSFGDNKPRSIIVQNDEFIGAVTVANQPNFNVTSYPINPGQPALFPWLSKQALQWEKYRFSKLEFYFKREVSEFNTAGSAGKIIYSVDFDASDAPPSTKQQMEDTIPHQDGMPCEDFVLRLPPSLMNKFCDERFVRPGNLPGGSDIKWFDIGNLFVATQGVPSNVEIGELRVRYVCRLSIPVLEPNTTAPTNMQVTALVGSVTAPVTGTIYTSPLATVQTNGLNVVNSGGNLTLPPGNYMITCAADFSTTTAITEALVELVVAASAVVTAIDEFATAAGCTSLHVVLEPYFFVSNGTNSFNLETTLTGTGTLGTIFSSMFIQAV